jgi:hypothetical protein
VSLDDAYPLREMIATIAPGKQRCTRTGEHRKEGQEYLKILLFAEEKVEV